MINAYIELLIQIGIPLGALFIGWLKLRQERAENKQRLTAAEEKRASDALQAKQELEALEERRRLDAEKARQELAQKQEEARLELQREAEDARQKLLDFFMTTSQAKDEALRELESRNLKLSGELGVLTSKVSALQHDSQKWEALYHNEEEERLKIRTELDSLREEFNTLKLERSQLVSERSALLAERKMYKEQLGNAQKTIESYERIMAQQAAQIEKLEKNIAALEARVDTVEHKDNDIPDAA